MKKYGTNLTYAWHEPIAGVIPARENLTVSVAALDFPVVSNAIL